MSELAPELADDPVTKRSKARIGSVLRSKWRIDRLLGIGGMAAVYEGTHRNGKRGAIKMLHLEYSTDADTRTRFLREGYVANTVNHPGAVSVFDDDIAEDGSVFIVMELLIGKTLAEMSDARPDKRLGVLETFRMADQLLDVLAAAHDKGVVHRDLKPDNIFVMDEGPVKILDFGIARMREVQANAKMTKTGSAMGTPAFMPPEQALGEWNRVDGRSDLWALGATMFAVLTGRLVHEAETLNQLLLKAMTHPAPPIRNVLPGLPSEIAEPVDKVLSFDMNARFPDARTMQTAIRRGIAWLEKNGEPTNLVPTRAENSKALVGFAATALPVALQSQQQPQPQRSKMMGIVVGAVVLTVVTLGIVIAVKSSGPSVPITSASDTASAVATPKVSAVGPMPSAAPTAAPSATASVPVPMPSGTTPTAPTTVKVSASSTKAIPSASGSGKIFGGFQ
ncbi:MAG TPA: serine/threonine-protein kinase [Polyangium sp.]|nr:serine/threonine-protein kinase [Polyangium sp.]